MRNDMFIDGEFSWFMGVIEEVIDPKKRNRVKVRCFGYHTDNKALLDTKDLPWATVMMPNTSPSVDGIGMNHQLLTGSWVIGFFRDGPSAQDPIVMGSLASFTEEAPDASKGFTGNYGNTAGKEDLPIEVDADNKNQVLKTVGGHLVELDNTVGLERINIKHGTNTSTLNIDQDGITILKSTGIGDEPKTHTLTLNPSTNTINLLHHSGTTINISEEGTVSIDAVNDIVNIDGNTTITGTLHVTEEQTNDKTITATDSITGKGVVLDTHTHTISSGSSAGNTQKPD